MKLEVERTRLKIIPETPQDEAMLEEVFALRREGDFVKLVRRNASRLSCWAYAEVNGKGVENSETLEN